MTSKIEQVDEILVKDPGDEEEYNILKQLGVKIDSNNRC